MGNANGCFGTFQPVRILCYGDSNTSGVDNTQQRCVAYPNVLLTSLQDQGVCCDVHSCGLAGLTASDLVEQMHAPRVVDLFGYSGKGLVSLLDEGHHWDLVVIMVGTNDIGHRLPLHSVMQSVRTLHGECHRRGIRTLGVIPPSGRHPMDVQGRENLAEMLQSWERSTSLVTLVDAYQLAPAAGCWKDHGVHFTAQGANQFGVGMSAKVMRAIGSVPAPTKPGVPMSKLPKEPHGPPSRRRRTGRREVHDICGGNDEWLEFRASR